MYHKMGIDARQSSRRSSQRIRKPHFTLSTFRTAIVVCAIFLAPHVNAEDPLTFHVPGEVTLCLPVNFTWTGGTPPYRFDVEPSVNGVPNTTANKEKTGIQTTWVLWTPDFPAGSMLEINVVGSGFAASSGGFTDVSSSSDSSCLSAASSTTSATSSSPSASSSAGGLVTSVDQPSATSSPSILTPSRSGMGKGAIAGIAVAAALTGIGLTALVAWYFLRRRSREQHPEKGYERTIASPTVPYSDPSSTPASDDPNNLIPPMSILGNSSDASEDRDPLRATPYLVTQKSSTFLSQAGSKKRVRDLSNATSNESAANTSTGASEIRTMSASPNQLVSVDGQDAGDGNRGDNRGGGVLRFDAGRPSRPLGLGFEGGGASDVASNLSEATPPPPYSAI